MKIPNERLMPLLETMLVMRRTEEKICEMGPKEVFGVYHAYIGQEATGAAVISQLGPEDAVFSTHRNHGHNLAKGVTPEQLLGEMLLRQTGASSGKGGTQHIMSRELKTVATSILGGSTILATGAALAAQVMDGDWISVGFLGERSTNEGSVAEALNLASFWDLPVLYVCENNNAVPYEPRRYGTALAEIVDLARAYRVRAEAVDATNPEEIYPLAEELVRHVRSERRPAFLEARTPALPGRSRGEHPNLDTIGVTDLAMAWAPPKDDPIADWHRADPVLRMVDIVLGEEAATREEILTLDRGVRQRVARAAETARAAPFPEPEQALADVLAGGDLWPR
jgi:TPP-dependent pyruvate/acetoin dehydrogenase alpha subunit